jgi:hypothetical protein
MWRACHIASALSRVAMTIFEGLFTGEGKPLAIFLERRQMSGLLPGSGGNPGDSYDYLCAYALRVPDHFSSRLRRIHAVF